MLGDIDEAEGVLKFNSKRLESSQLKKLDKSEKSLITAIYNTSKDIRIQLNEQLRCLDSRLEAQQGQLSEIQDIFKRRAEIELNYSRDLDRLAKLLSSRQKEQKAKREGWSALSSQDIWRQLVAEIKKAGRDHNAIAEVYSSGITNRCLQLSEDISRIYKKCREIGFEIHEEVLKVLHELHTAMKTHHTYQSEFRQAESKLQMVEKQRAKIREQIPKEKLEKNRKYRVIEKEVTKRTSKYTEARVKATKARNEYLLCMDAANASIHKYFTDDLSDLIDCMDFGFHQSLSRAMMMRSSAIDQLRKSLQQDVDVMNKVMAGLDSRRDKKNFLERNDQAFMIPKKFEYQPVRRDETELVQKNVLEELQNRKVKLGERLASLRAESEEIWKSLEAAEKTLLEMVNCADYDTTRFFVEEEATRKERESESLSNKQRVDRTETEQFYLAKFREYVLNSNRISRLQAKYDHIRKCLGDHPGLVGGGAAPSAVSTLPRPITNSRRRIGRATMLASAGQPKLFGGSLEEYVELTQQDIPLVVKSCIRVINLYGLHHQGIFRVSGSQVEINNFREAFERGEDPLAEMTDASDINSVCGVLKLYLRELREPIFSVQYFDQFMDLARLESKHEFVVKVRDLVKSWPRPIFVVMRYLFAFLNHLSEYSDENMMDPYNLAICFGPTLVPIPTDRDQVQFQNLVNELIKNFIIFHEDIFPTDELGGPVYEKYISSEPDDVQEYTGSGSSSSGGHLADARSSGGASLSLSTEERSAEQTREEEEFDESEVTEDEGEVLEAQAQYDFTARSSREVSFRKGDNILLYTQVSGDWWRGSVAGREGLVPDKYILLKIRGEDDGRDLSLPSISEDQAGNRRRSTSQSDTLRSSRSNDHSPRSLSSGSGSNYQHHQSPHPLQAHRSLSSAAPSLPVSSSSTPPLSRAVPHRHSISHPVGSSATQPPRSATGFLPPASPAAMISVAAPTPPGQTTTGGASPSSRDSSVSFDSGNPSPDPTFASSSSTTTGGAGSSGVVGGIHSGGLAERWRRTSSSPPSAGLLDSDSRSLDLDSLSVDESLELVESTAGGATVIHLSGEESAESQRLDNSVQSGQFNNSSTTVGIMGESFDMAPSSEDRLVLSEDSETGDAGGGSSHNSLASSTGSNHELRLELERERETVLELVDDVMRRTSAASLTSPRHLEAQQSQEEEGGTVLADPAEVEQLQQELLQNEEEIENEEVEEDEEEDDLSSPANTIVEKLAPGKVGLSRQKSSGAVSTGAVRRPSDRRPSAEDREPIHQARFSPDSRSGSKLREVAPAGAEPPKASTAPQLLGAKGKSPSFIRSIEVAKQAESSVAAPSQVLLKQSSWASRHAASSGSMSAQSTIDQHAGIGSAGASSVAFGEDSGPHSLEANLGTNNYFQRKRELWEKRSASAQTASSDEERGAAGGGASGFRGNRSFWEQRTTGAATPTSRKESNKVLAGQTPDLVMDLPSGGGMASSPPSGGSPVSHTTSGMPVPKPRLSTSSSYTPASSRSRSRSPSNDSVVSNASSNDSSDSSAPTGADLFAAADTDTLKKVGISSSGAAGSSGAPPKPRPRPDAGLSSPIPLVSEAAANRPSLADKRGGGGVRLPHKSASDAHIGVALPRPVHPTASYSISTPVGSKPALRVKPVLQVKPTDLKGAEQAPPPNPNSDPSNTK